MGARIRRIPRQWRKSLLAMAFLIQSSFAFSASSVIELTNGRVLVGTASENGDQLEITATNGLRVNVPLSEVAKIEEIPAAPGAAARPTPPSPISSSALLEKAPSPQELLERYATTQQALDSFGMKCEVSIEGRYWVDKGDPLPLDPTFNSTTFWRDGERWLCRSATWGGSRPDLPYRDREEALNVHSCWDGERYFNYQSASGATKSAPGALSIVDARSSVDEFYTAHFPYIGRLFGYYLSLHRVDRYLHRAASVESISVRPKRELVADSLCWVIDAETDRGKHVIWIDPDRGHNIVRADVEQQKGDFLWAYEKESIIDDDMNFAVYLYDVRLEPFDNTWLPTAGTAMLIEDWARPPVGIMFFRKKESIHRFEIEELTLDPEFGAANIFDIRGDVQEGARVIVGTDMNYEWRDGKPEPVAARSPAASE